MADLEVTLGAKLDQFARDMDEAGNIAERKISEIEDGFAKLNPSFGNLAGLGTAFAGITAGASAFLALLVSINSEIAQLGTGAAYLNTTTKDYQELLFAARSFGVSNSESVTALENMGRLLNDAQRNENSLTKLFDANGISLKNANGQLISIDQLLARGADLVQHAGSYADKVEIAKLLGLTKEWVPALEQGAGEFEKIKQSADDAGGIIDAQTIKKAQDFEREWQKSSASWAVSLKAAAADILPYIDDLVQKAAGLLNKENAKAAAEAGLQSIQEAGIPDSLTIKVPDSVASFINHFIDGLHEVGVLASSPAAVRIADAFEAIAHQGGQGGYSADDPIGPPDLIGPRLPPGWKPQVVPSIPGRPVPEDALDRSVAQVEKRTAEYDAEAAAVGKDTQAKIELKAAADLETAAKRAGIPVTDELRQGIEALAEQEGNAAQRAALANQAFAKQQELLNAVGDQAISVLDGLRTGSLSASQAVSQLTNFLINAIEKATLLGSGPLAGLFGTQSSPGSGATGGIIGALGNLFGAGGGAAPGSITVGTQSFPAFAGGTDSAPGGLSIVGENGPELVNLPKGSQVVPNDVLRRNGGGVNVVINNAPSTPQVSSTPNGNGGMDVAINFVRGVISNDLINGTGIAPGLKKFANASGFRGS